MLIDSHCHLISKRYGKNPETFIKEAQEAGVTKLVTIGTSLQDSQNAIRIAEQFENVYATAGVYPHEERDKSIVEIKTELEKLAENKKVVAIGECGIDISDWQNQRSVEEQTELFEMQVALSIKHNLPLAIHNRNGNTQILEVLKKNKGAEGIFHCFSSTWEFAQQVLDLGFYISFSATITYPTANKLAEVVQKVPLDKFLVETDSPYLPPQSQRGQVNEPKNVKIVAQKIADLKDLPFSDICAHSFKNTCAILGL